MSSEDWTEVVSRRRHHYHTTRRPSPPPPPESFAHCNPFDVTQNLNQLKIARPKNSVVTASDVEIHTPADDIPVQSTGENVPPPAKTFAEIPLGKAMKDNVKRCGFVRPTPVQRHAIPVALAGRDLMACAQTGSGKTAAFLFPIISGILKNGLVSESFAGGRRVRAAAPVSLVLLLAPTRELACQIYDEAKKFAIFTGVKIAVCYGGAPMYKQLRDLEKGPDILVATPGRLADLINRGRVTLGKVKYLTLDEADRMLDMGFEPQIRKFVEQSDMPRTGVRQTMLFSATFPTEIQKLASDFLSNYVFLSVGRVGSSTDRIVQKLELVENMGKKGHLINMIRVQKENGSFGKHALMLVFVETKRGADELEKWLQTNGFRATAIHGDKVQVERERSLHLFKTGVTPILVATDVAARGLDISNVAHVVNFDLPKNIDSYVHRIGRTGRAGRTGTATAFFTENNAPLAKALVELMREAKQEVPDWLNEFAEKSSSYGGTCDQADGQAGGEFGGFDYRCDDNSSTWDNAGGTVQADDGQTGGGFGGYNYRSDVNANSWDNATAGTVRADDGQTGDEFGGYDYRSGVDANSWDNAGDFTGTTCDEYGSNVAYAAGVVDSFVAAAPVAASGWDWN